jgi:ABC-type phosphate transport system substrate-binding protein
MLFFVLGGVAQASSIVEQLAGPSFSPADKIHAMPPEWEKRPIEYDASLRDADLVVSLDQQMYRVLSQGIKEYAREKGLKIVVIDSTCGNSMGMLFRKKVDIGGLCCPPAVSDRLPGLRFYTLGITSVAILVHPDNPIDGITLEQARKIFRGDVHRWPDVKTEGAGRWDHHIRVVGRLHCKRRPGHWRLLLDNEDLFSPDIMEVGTIPDMVSAVASSPAAIGHATPWLASRYSEGREKVKALKIDGYGPDDLRHLLSGDYPIYKTFSVTLWESEGAGNPHARALVEYMISYVEDLDSKLGIIAASRLREAGWKFKDYELVGEPK